MYKDISEINKIEASSVDALSSAIVDMMEKFPGMVPWGASCQIAENKYTQILVNFNVQYIA